MAGMEPQNTMKEALNALFHHLEDAFRMQAVREFQHTVDDWQKECTSKCLKTSDSRDDKPAEPLKDYPLVRRRRAKLHIATVSLRELKKKSKRMKNYKFLSMKVEAVKSRMIPTANGFHSQHVNQLVARSFGAGGMIFDAEEAREFTTTAAGGSQTEWLHIRRKF